MINTQITQSLFIISQNFSIIDKVIQFHHPLYNNLSNVKICNKVSRDIYNHNDANIKLFYTIALSSCLASFDKAKSVQEREFSLFLILFKNFFAH